MKLRQTPEDFIVDEVPDFTPDPAGRFFVYQITKRSIATLEVLELLRKALRLSGSEVSASGLKDKHAIATQLVSLPRPLPASFKNEHFDWKFVGKSAGRLTADNVGGNRFRITARELSPSDLSGLDDNAAALTASGVPNFYDSQRFGGGGPAELPGRALVRGDFMEALRMHLAVPRRKQSMTDKRIRREAQAHWGDWATILRKIPRCREQAPFAYLAAVPDDLVGALDRCDQKVLQLYVAAYQSHLFNETLRRVIADRVPEDSLRDIGSKAGRLPFWWTLADDVLDQWRDAKLPLLASDSNLSAYGNDVQAAVAGTLSEEGIELEALRVKGLKNVRLRSAERPLMIIPTEFSLEGPMPDELNPGYQKLTASFTLPKGAFATIVMKRLGMRPYTHADR